MTHSYEEQNKSVKLSWLMYVSINLLWYVWPMIVINMTKLGSQTFGEECLAPSGNRTTIPPSSSPCHLHCINWVLCRKGPTFILKKRFIAQKVYTACTMTSYKIVPLTNFNKYLHYDTSSRSQWPRGLRRRSTAARLLRSWVRIPPRAWMFVLWVLCVVR